MTSVGARDWARTDFYAVLGLAPSASAAEVEAAYRRLAKELHPDRNPDLPDASDRFAAVVRAREILGEEGLRRRTFLHAHGTSTPKNRVTESHVFDRIADAYGIEAWPVIPKGTPWKEGVAAALGEPDLRELWRRILGSVHGWGDLEQSLVLAVESLIDFVTEPTG